jgi:hypothetical protein
MSWALIFQDYLEAWYPEDGGIFAQSSPASMTR